MLVPEGPSGWWTMSFQQREKSAHVRGHFPACNGVLPASAQSHLGCDRWWCHTFKIWWNPWLFFIFCLLQQCAFSKIKAAGHFSSQIVRMRGMMPRWAGKEWTLLFIPSFAWMQDLDETIGQGVCLSCIEIKNNPWCQSSPTHPCWLHLQVGWA